jgi:hypothetical protein
MYWGTNPSINGSVYMCNSLRTACERGVITAYELAIAAGSIETVIRKLMDPTKSKNISSTWNGSDVKNKVLHELVDQAIEKKLIPEKWASKVDLSTSYARSCLHIYTKWVEFYNDVFSTNTNTEVDNTMIYAFPKGHKFHRYGYDVDRRRVVSFVRSKAPYYLADSTTMRLNGIPTTRQDVYHEAVRSRGQQKALAAKETSQVTESVQNQNYPRKFLVIDSRDGEVLTCLLDADSEQEVINVVRELVDDEGHEYDYLSVVFTQDPVEVKVQISL